MSGFAPEVVTETRTERVWEQRLRVPADLDCWPGHFPEWFVVPGVVQLGWVLSRIGEWLGGEVSPARIEGLKFKRPLQPRQEFNLRLELDASDAVFRFLLSEAGDVFSIGRVVLEESR